MDPKSKIAMHNINIDDMIRIINAVAYKNGTKGWGKVKTAEELVQIFIDMEQSSALTYVDVKRTLAETRTGKMGGDFNKSINHIMIFIDERVKWEMKN